MPCAGGGTGVAGGGLETATGYGNLTMEPMLDTGGKTYCTAVDFGVVRGFRFTGSGEPAQRDLVLQ